MNRKLPTAFIALTIIAAFAVSTTSASAVEFTEPTGTKLANGTKFLGTNVNGNMIVTDLNTNKLIECSSASMTGELASNGPSTVVVNLTTLSFNGTGIGGDCTSNLGSINWTTSIAGGLPYCLKTIEEKDEVEIRGGKCSEAARSIKFTLDFTSPVGTCGYEVPSAKGTFTTHTSPTFSDAVVHFDHAGPFKRFEQSGFVSLACPAEMTLDMSFTLETDEATVKPIYIS